MSVLAMLHVVVAMIMFNTITHREIFNLVFGINMIYHIYNFILTL